MFLQLLRGVHGVLEVLQQDPVPQQPPALLQPQVVSLHPDASLLGPGQDVPPSGHQFLHLGQLLPLHLHLHPAPAQLLLYVGQELQAAADLLVQLQRFLVLLLVVFLLLHPGGLQLLKPDLQRISTSVLLVPELRLQPADLDLQLDVLQAQLDQLVLPELLGSQDRLHFDQSRFWTQTSTQNRHSRLLLQCLQRSPFLIHLRLRCTDCPDIELCPECFSAGAEIGNHRRWHGYQQVDGGRFSLWGPEAEGGWTSREEQSLLDAIEQYGFGNWEDMAAHVGASRTPQEVMEHYVTMYIHGNLGKACIPDSIPNRVTDHTCPSGGPLSPSLTTPLPPLDISLAEQQQLGYMPLRDDYEIEYDQDAEKLISGLSVNYDDEDVEIEMKRAHVDMYVRKLRERQRRKNIARDYGLVPAFLGRDKKDKEKEKPGTLGAAGAAGGVVGAGAGGGTVGSGSTAAAGSGPVPSTPKRKITKEEKEQRVRLRGLCQFMAHREFEDFFENMHKERLLRAKVRELQRYRRNGITRLEESAEYEAARHKREKRKENKSVVASKRGGSGGGGLGSGMGLGGGAGGGGGVAGGLGGGAGIKEEGKDGEFAAIENLTGFELLSDREKVLCNSLNLSPARYLTVKTIIIKDHLQKRQGIPAKSRLPSYLDKVLKKRILTFLTESGWISRDAS